MGAILSLERLVESIHADRSVGLTIGLANGCFDLLHVGHVRYLSASAAEADRLVVAVNDDRSVAALKGSGRPIIPAAERAEIVAALGMVDYVVVFSTASVSELLDAVRPEVHCKGTDCSTESVPERGTVARYGGRTAIVGDPKEHSTRDLLTRIAATQCEPRQE